MKQFFVRLLTVGMLAGAIATAATYKVQLADRVQAGKSELQPGKYILDVDGTNAVLKDKSGNAIDVTAKVEQLPNKAPVTIIGTTGEAGAKKLASITLGRTQIRVVFE